MWDAIQAFVDGASRVADEETLFGQLERLAAGLGFPYYAFGSLWGDPAAMQDHPAPAVRLNYPQGWIDRYFERGYDKIDPVVLVAPYAQTSVTWDELRPYRPDLFEDAGAHGLHGGISIPLRAIQGCYVLCLVTDRPHQFEPIDRVRLEVLAHGFFAAYQRVRQISVPDYGLTPNTVEVIRLSMAGLAVEEIAERLGLSKVGVYWCIKDAKRRLKCANSAQLYLKAIQCGIVAV